MLDRVRMAAVMIAVGLWAATCQARAVNPVLEWNQIALGATVTAAQGPNPQTRSMAIVHIAIHDAVNSITGDYKTYLPLDSAPTGASPEAAAIAAAHRALVGLFTAPATVTALNAQRAASLTAHGLSESDPGAGWGDTVAGLVLALRATDGASSAQFAYTAPNAGDPGVWLPVGGAAPVLPGWGKVTPWVLRSASQFLPDEPPALDSGRYTRDYNEVKDLGSGASTTSRTAEQSNIARFWLASPSLVWNAAARQVVEARGLDLSSSARTFALMYLAASDAGIACWDAKYTYNFWRPFTAIRNGDADGNDRTVADTGWSAFLTTPQHPEYPSGHSTNSSAMATALALLFDDDPGITLTINSPTNVGFVRQWTAFSQGVDEVIEARIYSGFHYRTSMETGARLGRQVARFVMNHALGPVHGNGKDK
jgi:PAP2 superfamily protein